MQTLKVEQTLLQAGLLHSHLEMGHLLHIQAVKRVYRLSNVCDTQILSHLRNQITKHYNITMLVCVW